MSDQLTINEGQVPEKKPIGLKEFLQMDSIKSRFAEILGKNAASFISSILSVTKTNQLLSKCDPESVIQAAVMAAILKLPIQPGLGFAHIVPYNGKAQFQIGWKGFVQLAIRSGQYKTINCVPIYKGMLIKSDWIDGFIEVDPTKKESNEVIGYVGYFCLINGFEKYHFMAKEQCEAHGRKYSKSYSTGQWTKDFDSMALKTVVKLLLSKWGILSIEMEHALTVDQAVIKDAETMDVDYVDASADNIDTNWANGPENGTDNKQ